jgi:hypothetical protein
MSNSKVALIVAAALGLAGAAMNLVYLRQKAGNFEKVEFIGIAKGINILPGDRFTEDKLVPVPVPNAALGELPLHAVLWQDRQTVIGMPAVKAYTQGGLLLREDLKTPPAAWTLAEDERLMFFSVDTRTFVPTLVNPGDLVSFFVTDAPTPAAPQNPEGTAEENENAPAPPPPVARSRGRSDLIGPFRVMSIGNRRGSIDVHKAAGMTQLQENVISVAVKYQGDQLDAKAARLSNLMQSGGLRQAGVVLHPRTGK